MQSKYKILLVDDEPDILEFLTYNLEKEGYQVYVSSNGKEAIEKAQEVLPHLILLDIMMPELDGIATCEEIKKIPSLSHTIIIFLTARSEEYSQIAGFDAGADDYISKPVKPKVLLRKIKAIFSRYTNDMSDITEEQRNVSTEIKKYIVIDKERYVVYKNGIPLSLPRKEFELLALLVSKPNRVFTRAEIYDIVWGDEVIVGDRTIDVHIRKLREKIGGKYIKTIKGVGYKYNDAD